MDTTAFASKTYSPADLAAPDVAPAAGALQRFALRLGLSGVPFGVNGVLRRRFRVRQHNLWEYARGVACVLANQPAGGACRVLDFGGGATLPVFYLAHCGCEVFSLDLGAPLVEATRRVAERRGWKLRASPHDLTALPPAEEWGRFDAVLSFSVLEHLAKPHQPLVLERLSALLKPGGVLAVTFDFGPDAPMANAVRSLAEVEQLVAATRLAYLDGRPFTDTGGRFALDKRYPHRRFTFGSFFLRQRGPGALER
jgi:SAM-dependent methyltransferase